jgi:DNA-binding IclR family transcriptional regulator
MTRPAHCSGVGKAMLAFLPDQEVEKIIKERGLERITNSTIADKKAFRAELTRIRRQAYAVDNEETLVGAKCVAAVIRDSNDEVVAAISISAPKERLNQNEMRRMIPLVKETADKISMVLKEKGFTKEALYR